MAETELYWLSLAELAPLIRTHEVSPVEITQVHLDRISSLDRQLTAYITVTADLALAQAQHAEQKIMSGHYQGPLHGVPYSVKDIYATKGIRTTAGSKILQDWIPDFDSTVCARLSQAGAILLGKTNTHEFAYGGTTDNPHWGTTRNPWDLGHIPGGSSGGSGTAVAAGLATFSLGSDTGGSIRCPAAFCGIVGLKPTYGRVSCYGMIPQAWSCDHAGPMARSVEDIALILQAIAGYDPLDPVSSQQPVPDFTKELYPEIRGLRLGIPRELVDFPVEPAVRMAFEQSWQVFEKLGATVKEISIPGLSFASATNWAIILPETCANHEENLLSRPEDYGEDVRTLLELGKFSFATDYIRAQRMRRRIIEEVEAALREQVDLLFIPSQPIAAPSIGQRTVVLGGVERDPLNSLVHFTCPFNLTGLPALALPAGFNEHGLPLGIQLVGRAFDESLVLRVGYAYEQATEWHRRHPPLF